MKNGDTVFFVENNIRVVSGTVIRADYDFILVRPAGSDGALRLRKSRFFETKEEAESTLRKPEKKSRNPYGYFP